MLVYDKERYSNSISIIRVFSTICILLCHLVQEVNNPVLALSGQFFNVGVSIFFFMSGFLFGEKKISDSKEWLKRRFIKIGIPYYLFLIFIFCISLPKLKLSIVLMYLFNIQGILNKSILGLGHLWFLSYLMICYVITPYLYKNKDRICSIKVVSVLVIIQLIVGFFFGTTGGFVLYFLVYILGYFWKYIFNDWITISRRTIIWLVITFVCIVLRIIGRFFLDDTSIYLGIVVPYSQAFLAISLFMLIYGVTYNSLFSKNVNSNRLFQFFHLLSYEIYLVHYMFCVGPLRIMSFTGSYILNIGLFFVLTIIFAYFLYYISQKVVRFISRRW